MDIGLLAETATSLDPNLLPEVQEGMHKGGRDTGETQTIAECKGGGQEQWGVLVILFFVESKIVLKDTSDVISVSEAIIRCTGGNGEVSRVEGICPVHGGGDDPEEEDEATNDVGFEN